MTLQEAKDQVVKKYGYDLPEPQNEFDQVHYKMLDEAAKLYARSKWKEACETVNKMQAGGVYLKKPEFKP